jgi:DNA-binding transcriptional MerR regulator
MAIDLDEAKKFMNDMDKQSRELELEKAKLEQRKEIVEKNIEENKTKMEKHGCTPETIKDVIDEKTGKAQALRTKMEGILSNEPF